MGTSKTGLLWALVAGYALLVFALGEPLTGGLSVGAAVGLIRRREACSPGRDKVGTPGLVCSPGVAAWAA
jgi:hypothetical protein